MYNLTEKKLTLYKGKLSFRDEASTYFLVIFFSWKPYNPNYHNECAAYLTLHPKKMYDF